MNSYEANPGFASEVSAPRALGFSRDRKMSGSIRAMSVDSIFAADPIDHSFVHAEGRASESIRQPKEATP